MKQDQQKPVSILNDVLGPVMRGPSSSHTAGAFHIGRMTRALLDNEPTSATFTFDPDGSLAQVYRQQGSDRGFAAGLLGRPITDERFQQALELATEQGVDVTFRVEPLPGVNHPNTVGIRAASRSGHTLRATAKSVGGGAIIFTQVNDWPVRLTGDAHEVLVELEEEESGSEQIVRRRLTQDAARQTRAGRALLHVRRASALEPSALAEIRALSGVRRVWTVPPVFHVQRGAPIASSAAEMVALARSESLSLGQVALAYESTLLGLPEREVIDEVTRRFDIMRAAVHRGLADDPPPMQHLQPSAGRVYRAEAQRQVAVGGIHTRAAARAMAVMHVNGGMGIVCAAPTAGSAGVIPGALVTLAEEKGLDRTQTALGLLAAAGVGLVVGTRATFAAEVAGCQVEIGAAGGMAAAAVVEIAGGSAHQASDAAAIALQNTMGLICDMVQGVVEIPCHTRNAVAAANAFICADLILGGYANPIPLDETVDAVYAVGRTLPRELKCTALGGLACAPSARALDRRATEPQSASSPDRPDN